jgi:Fe-S-cluster-containing hydrogenase component 2
MMLTAVHANCSGCGTCRLACAIANFNEVRPAKALLRIEGRFPAPGDYRIHLCDQCGECAEACPEEAIEKGEGVYRVVAERCSGCMSCVAACPNAVMMVLPGTETPAKCTLCGECAAICPREAILIAEEREAAR